MSGVGGLTIGNDIKRLSETVKEPGTMNWEARFCMNRREVMIIALVG